jgi:DNA-binding transcriptional LysR family regulator
MDWDKLRIFHAVASAGSFTHAGQSLGLSQSAVSRQISALEEEISTPLFQRHARGLTLTDEGQLLFGAVTDVLSRLAAAEEALKNVHAAPRGPIKITTAHGIGAYWLLPRLGSSWPPIRKSNCTSSWTITSSTSPSARPISPSACARPSRRT